MRRADIARRGHAPSSCAGGSRAEPGRGFGRGDRSTMTKKTMREARRGAGARLAAAGFGLPGTRGRPPAIRRTTTTLAMHRSAVPHSPPPPPAPFGAGHERLPDAAGCGRPALLDARARRRPARPGGRGAGSGSDRRRESRPGRQPGPGAQPRRADLRDRAQHRRLHRHPYPAQGQRRAPSGGHLLHPAGDAVQRRLERQAAGQSGLLHLDGDRKVL